MNISAERLTAVVRGLQERAAELEDAKDDAIEDLSERVARLQDEKREAVFEWQLIALMMLNYALLDDMQTWAAAIGVLVIELILVYVLARRGQIEEVQKLIDRLVAGWVNKKG
jgi:uncharacterized membrane protein